MKASLERRAKEAKARRLSLATVESCTLDHWACC
jgi:hypothetical protein